MDNPLVDRMTGFGTSIFSEMTQRALRFEAVNLGQGFPDTDTPEDLKRVAGEAITGGLNQYPPALGMPVLREAVSEHQARFYGLAVDPDREVLVTVGATEALSAAVLALVEPGEEVVTFEPFYDAYAAAVALAGACHVTVPLHFPDLAFDVADLAAAITPRTRLILLNNPHNPTGKVFTEAELTAIAEVARAHDLVVLTDEVYEHLTFDGRRHLPVATLPGMAERTLTVSSGGKTFSATGWKVGWIHGPAELVAAVAAVKQFLTFVASGPFQPAIAHGLRLPDQFFTDLAAGMAGKRDVLVDALTGIGVDVSPCAGTYFVVADMAALGVSDAVQFCRDLPERAGVVGVPVSAFCTDSTRVVSLVRFAFCKEDSVLREGARRLATLRGTVG